MLIPKQPKMPDKTLKAKKKFIRDIGQCLAAGMHIPCSSGLDPAHYKRGSYAGKNLKNHDRINPLCRAHHILEGNMGEKAFWGDIDARGIADFIHECFENGDLLAAKKAVIKKSKI